MTADNDKLNAELYAAQEALHTFTDTNQTAANRKAAKRRFVEAALALEPQQDPGLLWETAELLSSRDNSQNNVLGSSFSPEDLETAQQVQADINGNAVASAFSEAVSSEHKKALAAEQDRITDFLSYAFENQFSLFVELDTDDGKVPGPLSEPIEDYSEFAEWLILRTLIHGYSFLHFSNKEYTGYFPRFDRAKGYVVVNFTGENAAAYYELSTGRANKAEANGDFEAAKRFRLQAETFKAVADHNVDSQPGEPKLFPAPVWGPAITMDTLLAAMFPDVELPDREAVKNAYWLLNERLTRLEFVSFAFQYAPELSGLVHPVITLYSDIVRASKAGAGLPVGNEGELPFDAGRPKRTIKIETLKQRILNVACVVPNAHHVALGFGKRPADVSALLRDNGISASKRGPKKGRKVA